MHDYLGEKKHDLTVFAVGMPDIWAVPASAAAAFYLSGEDVYSTVVFLASTSLQYLTLDHLEHFRLDNGFVVILYIVLWNFSLIDFGLLGKKVSGVGLL